MIKQIAFAALMIVSANFVRAQNQSVGIRFGEPMGIVYKKYLLNNKAIEFNLGTAPRGWSYYYYKSSFDWYKEYDDYEFRSQEVNGVIYLDARYLFQYDIPVEGMVGSLNWFWGIGALFKTARVEYSYIDDAPPFNWHTDERQDFDLGPQGIIGIEYTFKDTPVTLYADFNLLFELLDRPHIRLMGGTGVRYNF